MGIEQYRGIEPDAFELNDSAVLVRASVEAAAQAFKEARKLSIWHHDIYEREMEIVETSFLVFQFRGHPWTFIHELIPQNQDIKDDAQVLSQVLNTPALCYAISDTTGYFGYEFFDGGISVERFEHEQGDNLLFTSQLRNVAQHDRSRLVSVEAISNFMREQDIYISAFWWDSTVSGQPEIIQIQKIISITDDDDAAFFKRIDFERVDYLANSH
jgi:hypothetical protein